MQKRAWGIDMRRKAEKIDRSCGIFSIDDRQFNASDVPDRPRQDNMHPTPEQLLIREAAKCLTTKQKTVWELYNFDRYTQDEIAKKLGISQPVVAKHIKSIENRIKRWVKGNLAAYNLIKREMER